MRLIVKIMVTVNVVAGGTLYVAWRMLPEGSETATVLRETLATAQHEELAHIEAAPFDTLRLYSLRPGKLLGYLNAAVPVLEADQARAERVYVLFTIALSIVGMNAVAAFVLLLHSQAGNDCEEKGE